MEVTELILTKECFPRLLYASRNIPALQARFYRMMEKAGIRETEFCHALPLDSVHIYICKQNGESEFIRVQDTVIRYDEDIKGKPPSSFQTLSSFLDVQPLELSVIITSTCLKDDLLKLDRRGHMIVLVAKSKSEANKLSKEFRSTGSDIISAFSTKESLASDISILLEQMAYQPLKSQYAILQDLLSAKNGTFQETLPEYESDEVFGYKAKRHEFDRPNAISEEAVELMCEEILALYDSTKVPKEQRPETTRISEEMIDIQKRDELFALCPTIKAIGNRFEKIHVYVENITNKNEIDTRERKIAAFMNQHHVQDYAITPVFPQLQELFFLQVGDKIEAHSKQGAVNKSGTLGCLAKMNENHTMKDCLLLSRHVASDCTDVFVVKNERKRKVATIIKRTTENDVGSLDIAAAEIENVVIVDNDARKLKDSVGINRQGKLDGCFATERIIRPGKRVHIWGSQSQPGKGIVTDASYYVDGMSVSLIQIQDEEGYNSAEDKKPFAVKGDSGAIVCSDDPDDEHVNAHAMLMGSNSECTYLSLPLREGVMQLEKKSGNKFILFE